MVSEGADYPPPPWRLGGSLLVSVFSLPAVRLPADAAVVTPGGVRPFTVAGRAFVGVVLAGYTASGVLAYDELMVAIGGFQRWRPVSSIAQIWVDSPRSRAGGRALWGIPKELGDFERSGRGTGVTVSVSEGGKAVAGLEVRTGGALLPGLRRIPLTTAQRMDGVEIASTNVVLARVRHVRAEWSFDPSGPLGWLHGRSPLMSVGLTDATIVFGTKTERD